MKRIIMVLPFAVLLAYCSGPNNTQTTTDTDLNGNSSSVSASTTTTTDMATNSTDVKDVNTNTSTITTDAANNGTLASNTTTASANSTSNSTNISASSTITMDTTDPMYRHFEMANGGNWTWDMNYPGYDRPAAGSYNSAINGNWQLVMTPELVSAWRQDSSRSLWSSGYAYDGRYLGGDTYLSASESFNTRDANLNTGTATNANTQGSLQVNGSTSAGTVSSNNTSSSTSGVNNNASANASVANQMNGSTSGSATTNATTGVTGSTMSGSVNNSSNNNGSTSVTGNVSGSASTTTGTLNESTSVNSNLDSSSINSNMDLNSINYNAANGNMYQMPKFNLYLDNGSFTGYTGCNGISGRVSVMGTSLHFLNTTPSTNIDCLGGLDQNALLDLLKRVDSYAYVGDELQLMQGNQVLLRFHRDNANTSLQ